MQELIDCGDFDECNDGCDGGVPTCAFDYVIEQGGMVPLRNYKYKGKDGKCKEGLERVAPGVKQKRLPTQYHMKKALRHGPIVASIDGDDPKIQHYQSGVFTDTVCGEDEDSLNHAIVIVGYTKDFWIVRNSWGTDWGIEGYAHFKMGNTCVFDNDAW